MCEISLRGPVTGVERRREDVVDLFHNLRDLEDVVCQSEGLGIEVEVSVRGRIVTCLILGPVDFWMVRRGDTVVGIA
jgi:hypothetical protein